MSRLVPLADLDGPGDSLALDSQDILAALESAGCLAFADFATGVVTRVVDGEISALWWTDSSRPFALSALYEPVALHLAALDPVDSPDPEPACFFAR